MPAPGGLCRPILLLAKELADRTTGVQGRVHTISHNGADCMPPPAAQSGTLQEPFQETEPGARRRGGAAHDETASGPSMPRRPGTGPGCPCPSSDRSGRTATGRPVSTMAGRACPRTMRPDRTPPFRPRGPGRDRVPGTGRASRSTLTRRPPGWELLPSLNSPAREPGRFRPKTWCCAPPASSHASPLMLGWYPADTPSVRCAG
jgi:hypothetical protein